MMNRKQLRRSLKKAWKKENHYWDLKQRSKENWDPIYKSQRSKLLEEIKLNGFTKKAEALNILVQNISNERDYWIHKWNAQLNNCFSLEKQLRNLQKSK